MDFEDSRAACALVRQLRGLTGLFKIGSQLFTAEGPKSVERVAALGFGIFLDLKFHDIPNTVASAVTSAAELPGVKMLTLHALGGLAMMKAAREALVGKKSRPSLLAVTLLTSLDDAELRRIGFSGSSASRVAELAELAKQAGMDGVVASPNEVAAIRNVCGRDFLIVVPGIRPANATANDQSRIATPGEAIRAGASYLVVGRPITAAANPRESAVAIAREIDLAAASSTWSV